MKDQNKNRIPAEEELKAIAAQLRKPSGKKARETGDFMNTGNRLINLAAIEALDPVNEDHILEIGMGNGHFVREILSRYPDTRYTGCDFSTEMIEAAKEENAEYMRTRRASFVQAGAANMEFPDNTFSGILSVNTLYFWDDMPGIFREVTRVMKKDGRLVLAIRPKEIMAQYPFTRYGFKMFTAAELCVLIEENGLQITRLERNKEPDQDVMGRSFEVESLIAIAKKI